MIKKINLLQNAVAKKPIIPILGFICFYKDSEGSTHAQTFNGKVTLDVLFNFPYEVTVKADTFIRAIKACKGDIKFKITPKKRLSITSGKFKAYIETTEAPFPLTEYPKQNTASTVEVSGLLELCSTLKPFISEDASRAWSQSILVKNFYGHATNNIIITRKKITGLPDMVLPSYAVDILCTLGKEPDVVAVFDNYSVFYLDEECWLRVAHIEDNWPPVEDMIHPVDNTELLVDTLVEDLATLKPFFTDNKYPVIHLSEDGIGTEIGEGGATIENGKYPVSKYRYEMLSLIAVNATEMDFTRYPEPCYFRNANTGLDGIIIGLQ